jgi:hypothetical protein
MSNYTSFTIRFIRTDSSKDDDVVLIYPVKRYGDIYYAVEYKIAESEIVYKKNKNIIHKKIVNEDELKDYINSLIHIAHIDREPFMEYQFDLPSMPSIIAKQKDLIDVLVQIEVYLNVLFKNWPKKCLKDEKDEKDDNSEEDSCCEKKASHKYFNSDGETIYSEL